MPSVAASSGQTMLTGTWVPSFEVEQATPRFVACPGVAAGANLAQVESLGLGPVA